MPTGNKGMINHISNIMVSTPKKIHILNFTTSKLCTTKTLRHTMQRVPTFFWKKINYTRARPFQLMTIILQSLVRYDFPEIQKYTFHIWPRTSAYSQTQTVMIPTQRSVGSTPNSKTLDPEDQYSMGTVPTYLILTVQMNYYYQGSSRYIETVQWMTQKYPYRPNSTNQTPTLPQDLPKDLKHPMTVTHFPWHRITVWM